MGSSVIVAIKHNHNRAFSQRHEDLISLEINLDDSIPKSFTSDKIMESGHHFRTSELRDMGILVSKYHDNDYNTALIVNHDFMLSLDGLQSLNWDKVTDEKTFVRQLSHAIRKNSYIFRETVKKGYKLYPSEQPAPCKGDSPISLFVMQTDTLSEATESGNLKNLLSFCEHGIMSRRTFGSFMINDDRKSLLHYSNRIEYLGTLDRNTGALISMSYGQAKLIKIPNRIISMKLELNEAIEMDNYNKFLTIRKQAFRNVLAAFGFTSRKESDLEKNNSSSLSC